MQTLKILLKFTKHGYRSGNHSGNRSQITDNKLNIESFIQKLEKYQDFKISRFSRKS